MVAVQSGLLPVPRTHGQAEDDQADRIVEDRLTGNHGTPAFPHPEAGQHGQHRARVGRYEHGAHDDRDHPLHAEEHPQAGSTQGDPDEGPHDRQARDLFPVLHEEVHFDGEPLVEDQDADEKKDGLRLEPELLCEVDAGEVGEQMEDEAPDKAAHHRGLPEPSEDQAEQENEGKDEEQLKGRLPRHRLDDFRDRFFHAGSLIENNCAGQRGSVPFDALPFLSPMRRVRSHLLRFIRNGVISTLC